MKKRQWVLVVMIEGSCSICGEWRSQRYQENLGRDEGDAPITTRAPLSETAGRGPGSPGRSLGPRVGDSSPRSAPERDELSH